MRPAPLAAALALAPAGAPGQAFDGIQGVDTYTGPVISPARVLGLGGAYVAVAEGLAGAQSNPAAVGQRNRHLARGWDWDWLLTSYVPPPRDVARQDLGNDGYAEQARLLAARGCGVPSQDGPSHAGPRPRTHVQGGWAMDTRRRALEAFRARDDAVASQQLARWTALWAGVVIAIVLGAALWADSSRLAAEPGGAAALSAVPASGAAP